MIELPATVRAKAMSNGASDWIRDLDDLVAEMEQRWSIAVGAPFQDATEAFVAPGVRQDGMSVVLKIHIPREGSFAANEITTLRLANGEGCVRLLDDDLDLGVLLLERLGPSLFELRLPIGRRHEILCDVAARMWRPAPESGLPTGRERALAAVESICALWEELDHPCSSAAIEHARVCGERRAAAHDAEKAVLIHGDVHQWNTLQATEGFKLVDPDGGVAERECDLGVLMREDTTELLEGDPRERARYLANRCDLSAEAIWEWGVVERVWNGLLCLRDGMERSGVLNLRAADLLAR